MKVTILPSHVKHLDYGSTDRCQLAQAIRDSFKDRALPEPQITVSPATPFPHGSKAIINGEVYRYSANEWNKDIYEMFKFNESWAGGFAEPIVVTLIPQVPSRTNGITPQPEISNQL